MTGRAWLQTVGTGLQTPPGIGEGARRVGYGTYPKRRVRIAHHAAADGPDRGRIMATGIPARELPESPSVPLSAPVNVRGGLDTEHTPNVGCASRTMRRPMDPTGAESWQPEYRQESCRNRRPCHYHPR
jgi:hypothetical protein